MSTYNQLDTYNRQRAIQIQQARQKIAELRQTNQGIDQENTRMKNELRLQNILNEQYQNELKTYTDLSNRLCNEYRAPYYKWAEAFL